MNTTSECNSNHRHMVGNICCALINIGLNLLRGTLGMGHWIWYMKTSGDRGCSHDRKDLLSWKMTTSEIATGLALGLER